MSRKKRHQARFRRTRCGCYAPRDLTSAAAENWNGQWEGGRLVLILCPQCQIPLDNAAAEANGAEPGQGPSRVVRIVDLDEDGAGGGEDLEGSPRLLWCRCESTPTAIAG